MTTNDPDSPPARRRPRLLAVLLAAALLLVGGAACADGKRDAGPSATRTPIPAPVVTTEGLQAGRVPWQRPLSLSVSGGTLRTVLAMGPDGLPLDGTLTDTTWTSAAALLPATTYRLTATVVDQGGTARTVTLTPRTTPAAKTLQAVVSAVDRAAIEARLTVTSTPAVAGAWRWMSPTELHYRGPTYWPKGTSVHVRADFDGLQLSQEVWGKGVRTTAFSIGSALISTVDVQKKVMTVVRDGVLLRTIKVSTGRDKYPTKGGVHIVLEKTKLKIMDSATVGIPRSSPDGYYEKVPNSVRISYGGAFVHSADWSVRDQGVRNVSHGCVNISPADAAWFFDLVKRGDIVDVKNALVGPKLSDPGMSDWNLPFSQWAN
jgi:lipoprotein-anchoring transpeptidase ErfK/SrfK